MGPSRKQWEAAEREVEYHEKKKARYYKRVWGGLPELQEREVPPEHHKFYEQFFPLPELKSVLIGARTSLVEQSGYKPSVHNEIVIRSRKPHRWVEKNQTACEVNELHELGWSNNKIWRYFLNTKFQDFITNKKAKQLRATIAKYVREGRGREVEREEYLESEVSCTHTAIMVAPPFPSEGTILGVIHGDRTRVAVARFDLPGQDLETKMELRLPFEEHFVALRSFVEGLARLGIRKALEISYYGERYDPLSLPIGFNSAMQSQIFGALRNVANPAETDSLTREFVCHLVEISPKEWFNSRFQILDDLYMIRYIINEPVLEFIREQYGSSWFIPPRGGFYPSHRARALDLGPHLNSRNHPTIMSSERGRAEDQFK